MLQEVICEISLSKGTCLIQRCIFLNIRTASLIQSLWWLPVNLHRYYISTRLLKIQRFSYGDTIESYTGSSDQDVWDLTYAVLIWECDRPSQFRTKMQLSKPGVSCSHVRQMYFALRPLNGLNKWGSMQLVSKVLISLK